MGHNAGWLALGAGVAGGADVILIPEIPYSLDDIAQSITNRRSAGSRFSIVAVAEGATDLDRRTKINRLKKAAAEATEDEARELKDTATKLRAARRKTVDIAMELESRTGLEARVTILGHVQRGGAPSPYDRILATTLGAAATEQIAGDNFGIMVASRGDSSATVPLDEVAGKRNTVPADHPWIEAARSRTTQQQASPVRVTRGK